MSRNNLGSGFSLSLGCRVWVQRHLRVLSLSTSISPQKLHNLEVGSWTILKTSVNVHVFPDNSQGSLRKPNLFHYPECQMIWAVVLINPQLLACSCLDKSNKFWHGGSCVVDFNFVLFILFSNWLAINYNEQSIMRSLLCEDNKPMLLKLFPEIKLNSCEMQTCPWSSAHLEIYWSGCGPALYNDMCNEWLV